MFGDLGVVEVAAIVAAMVLSVAPFLLFGVGAYVLFSRSAMGQAILDRVRRDSSELPPAVAEEFDRLRGELQEVHERLDFTERMLAEAQEARRLDVGEGSRTPPEASAVL